MEVQWGQVDSYSEVQSVNGLTGKVQLKIPTKTSDLTNDSGYITEIGGDVATKDDIADVKKLIPDVSGLATKTEVATDISNVKSLIPDTSGFANKSDIPTEYLKSASVADNTLTITDNNGNATTFAGGGGSGGSNERFFITSDFESTIDKTNAEIWAAYQAGKDIYMVMSPESPEYLLQPVAMAEDLAVFSLTLAMDGVMQVGVFNIEEDQLIVNWSEIPFSQYATKSEIPTKTSQLTNDSGYLTSHQDISNLATKAALDEAAAKIPTEYLKTAAISNNKLSITDASGTEVASVKQPIYIDTQIESYEVESDGSTITGTFVMPDLSAADVLQLLQAGHDVFVRVTGEIVQAMGANTFIMQCGGANDSEAFFFNINLISRVAYAWIKDSSQFVFEVYRLATKANIQTLKTQIPTTYLKSASVSNNTLTITDASGTATTFTGGSTVDLTSYSNTTEVQAMIDTAISNITNANEVSY